MNLGRGIKPEVLLTTKRQKRAGRDATGLGPVRRGPLRNRLQMRILLKDEFILGASEIQLRICAL
jgi:hypothetical protein